MDTPRTKRFLLRALFPDSAFTLLELLVVIGMITILLGLVFPVFQEVQDRAKKVQAKNDLIQITTAVNAYYAEYGKYPIATNDQPFSSSAIADLFYTLRAKPSGANTSHTQNTRQIVFLSPAEDTQVTAKGKIGSDGQFHDPWGTAYQIAINGTYDNDIDNPYGNNGAGANPIRQGVIAWSYGKDTQLGTRGDGNFTNSDDVISWQ
jgi:type II secretory pathway pseudopilin PulG